ncbi:carboxypeptidase regulatory-like domain-containing protein [Chryseobacterium arthrosphaerae]|uniref:carboxypeptidase-like regulatory domain-containing protein n=1 Tax=Chryseobacterium arthrosphaerae TaxID=651561 RepID=UPI000F515091|nr:carboxypeptidase-like regulatory domain-containing protein [Chryseobacterium arthrosphaerae]AYZ12452.1 carboxypeptidase regulatory-like domain-containing protein [Chryseobacterium arthrosphaerae]
MKHSYLLFILFFGVFHSQQLKVLDAESGSPVPNARILLKDQIVYTNEDGIAPVSNDAPAFEVSASGYQKAEVRNFSPQIRLKPLYKDIGEIKIVNVDVKKIFEDVAKNYHKRYYNAPSLYDVVYKEKSFDNSKLFFLVIAEAKLWASDNMYNFKQGLRKDYDEILQMQLNNVKYLKNIKSDSIFTGKTNEFSHEYLGNFFLNFELYRELQHLKMKETKCTGRLIFEEGNEQLITFKISSANGVHMNGEFKYNTADKAITYFETHYFQENYPVVQRKTTDGKTFDYKLGDASLIFDFYKKNGSYIPAMTRLEGDKFTSYYNDETHVRKFSREMVYNTFTPSDKKGLDPKVDFKISIWNNDTVKENKVNTTLLSEEEKAFVNGK